MASVEKFQPTVATTKATGKTAGDTVKEKKFSLKGKYNRADGKTNAFLIIK